MKLDFFTVRHRNYEKKGEIYIDVYPEFLVQASEHLMIRGGKFYAVLNLNTGFWETNEFMIQKYVDEEIDEYARTNKEIQKEKEQRGKYCHVNIMKMLNSRSRSWIEYKNYVNNLPDNYSQLDDKLCFDVDKVDPKDHLSKKLPYKLARGKHDAWDELAGTLYAPDELQKIEWAIGSVIAGDSKEIQKFIVLYGEPGAGKGTILKIIQKMFPGYYEVFDAKSLGNSNNAFAFEQFRSNPLIALQMDGDLSKIEDNSKLNSLVSHETVLMNEKRKQSYSFTPRCFLFMASNKEVRMTDANSGLIRRLIDVNPSGKKVIKKEYDRLMGSIGFELGSIAYHCLDVYRKMGKNYYNSYEPTQMMLLSNPIFNFLKECYEDPEFPLDLDCVKAQDLFGEWLRYCERSAITNRFAKYQFTGEVRPYYKEFKQRTRDDDGKQVRNVLTGLKVERLYNGSFGRKDVIDDSKALGLVLDQTKSLLDDLLKDCDAQYAVPTPDGRSKPERSWMYCKTKVKDLNTNKLHFVRVPLNHIVIDFDLKNEKGEKDPLLNLEAAEKFPRTYAEYSQSGKGLHLHYIYNGDPMELAGLYSPDIEIKVYSGKLSLRRKLSLCNNIPVAVISSGLPKKEVSAIINFDDLKNEMHIRNIVAKCLRKDIAQPYTGPAMDLIKKTLDDAYAKGLSYDIRDMRPAIGAFAAKSSHQKEKCMKIANDLHYCSKDHEETTLSTKVEFDIPSETEAKVVKDVGKAILELEKLTKHVDIVETKPLPKYINENIVFFDVEVFPNLFLVNWKEIGKDHIAKMINPTRSEILELMHHKLVGFNCRRYDNHILYGRSIGLDNEQLYRLSQRIISGSKNAMYGNAYDISYTDIYDFAAKKQSLKKWEIELGIHHQELGLPWDQPVDPKLWKDVAEYCDNDVIATEAVFNHLQGDFKARQILADIAGMKVNDTTNQLTTRIIFGDDPKPQVQFNYPDLAKEFPGYRFVNGKSYYRHDIKLKKNSAEEIQAIQDLYQERYICWNGDAKTVTVDEEIGEGGRVFAVPGIHEHVITFDVASMHPSSIIAENGFGKYTELFKQLLDIRIAIKHRDFDKAKQMLDGKLAKYLDDPDEADALSQALKIAINSVYGLTAAGFDNKFRDPRNKDNWVAKRGALFIETLRLKVTEMGGKVVHIKTDSIKVVEPTDRIKNFIMDYGKQWGYTFEIEDIYEKMCLVNDAVYIALRDKEDPGWLKECRKAKKKAEETGQSYIEPTRWSATGAQFAHPYVFKTLFSHEPLDFRDLCETKSVTTALYLDFNENLSDVSAYEKDLEKLNKRIKDLIQKGIGLQMTVKEFEDMFSNSDEHVEYPVEKEPLYIQAFDLLKDKDVLEDLIAEGHKYQFVGKAGSFCPVRAGTGGGILCREKDGKFSAATGSKGYRWREGEALSGADKMDLIDMGYFENLATTAKEAVGEYAEKIGKTFDDFASEIPEKLSIDEVLDRSDKMFGSPQFDDESIARSKETLSYIVR